MNVKDSVNQLLQYVREGEICSCPVILLNDSAVELAVFTYYATEEPPITVFGYGQIIKTDGQNIAVEERELFQSEEELIVIHDVPTVSADIHQVMYQNYYQELQDFINNMDKSVTADNTSDLSKAFMRLIPIDALELYRRICPSFLELIGK